MATQIAKGHIYAIGANARLANYGSWACGVAYAFVPNLTEGSLTHEGEVDQVRGMDGAFQSLILDGEKVTIEFNVMPEGSDTNNANLSATIPSLGEAYALANFPNIGAGSWNASAGGVFNVTANAANVQGAPWFYQGGGRIQLTSTGKATMVLPLHRYPGILSPTKIT